MDQRAKTGAAANAGVADQPPTAPSFDEAYREAIGHHDLLIAIHQFGPTMLWMADELIQCRESRIRCRRQLEREPEEREKAATALAEALKQQEAALSDRRQPVAELQEYLDDCVKAAQANLVTAERTPGLYAFGADQAEKRESEVKGKLLANWAYVCSLLEANHEALSLSSSIVALKSELANLSRDPIQVSFDELTEPGLAVRRRFHEEMQKLTLDLDPTPNAFQSALEAVRGLAFRIDCVAFRRSQLDGLSMTWNDDRQDSPIDRLDGLSDWRSFVLNLLARVPGLNELQRLRALIEKAALLRWASFDARSLTKLEADIVQALVGQLTLKELMARAGYEDDTAFKRALRGLKLRGIVQNARPRWWLADLKIRDAVLKLRQEQKA